MAEKKLGKLILPAVKGKMGERDYFITAVRLQDVVARVLLAREIISAEDPPSKRLQRDIREKRFAKISKYLREKEWRFFNALVVGVYGAPKWRHFGNFSPPELSVYRESLGFLEFSGSEKMYAMDGQHRLRGIAVALEEGGVSGKLSGHDESIGVVFVEHRDTDEGVSRSRQLFVDLNKHAQKVSTRDIIYLDEDDIAAIITRKLIEGKGCFQANVRVHTAPENTLQDMTSPCFTTVGALYDCIKAILTKVFAMKNPESASEKMKSDAGVIMEKIEIIFDMMAKHVPELRKYFSAPPRRAGALAVKCRNEHLLFRPMGLKAFVNAFCCEYAESGKMKHYDKDRAEQSIKVAARLPLLMNKPPVVGLVWQRDRQKVITVNFPLLRQVYRYMLDLPTKSGKSELARRYGDAVGNSRAALPPKIIGVRGSK